ncbi:hypothetical protein G3580_15005 [Nitrogeniibacter mangrovi]|uniref:Uncharacterized protein n=1 Tax=Nitrogeniibacter mangrovi TaxID=2016596 RepID=A0A6C1B997_9RHOO|nr:hypothetical protein [Nitrogeniibacter mangrovi]QID18814.1 hypothetical protein G3580_15005 [Nitrogeniibacter mangrovi]
MIVRLFLSLAVIVAALVSPTAGAQTVRQLPADLVVTTMKANGGSVVLLGDKRVSLSPAAQIRGANNLLILPSYLYGAFRVGVKQDHQGLVNRIWILTDAEYRSLTQKK